jgi:pyruvate,water dikinase
LPEPVEEELVHLVDRAHWALGEGREPQDVEWAYDGEHLWLLQARPVTSLPRYGWPRTATLPRHWSTANLKDSLPGVPCELSWSTLTDIVPEALYAAQKAVQYPIPPGMEVVRRFQGRALGRGSGVACRAGPVPPREPGNTQLAGNRRRHPPAG